MKNSEIIIYKSDEKGAEIEVHLEKETVWLSQDQISKLFQRERSVVTKHINNVFKEKELDKESNVQILHISGSDRPVKFFNLDVIISVGYRVKSKQGTQFRIWANNVLKQYLIDGYAINEKKLLQEREKLNHLKDTIRVITDISLSATNDDGSKDILFQLLKNYSDALKILDDYDFNRIQKIESEDRGIFILEYDDIKNIIQRMKIDVGNSDLFGKEKDSSLKSSIAAIYQTFDGIDLYHSIEEKAANLLYFLVKNHSFADGNKRIAAAIFIYFLEKNKKLADIKMDNNLLVALTLLTAMSKPTEKELIVNIITVLLLSGRNN